MASSRKITAQWHLTDGVSGPFSVTKTEVCAALMEAGEIRNPDFGLRARDIEWIANREWVFETRFEKPETDDERIRLRIDRRWGNLSVYLNDGEAICPAGDAYELTGDICDGENVIRIVTAPIPHVNAESAAFRIGFEEARLETYNYIRLDSCCITYAEAQIDLEAFLSGRYRFVYTVSREGELITRTEIQERLPAARRHIVHAFDMGDADGVCDVMLTIERSGIGCETVRTSVLSEGHEAKRIIAAGEREDAWAELGAQAVSGTFTQRQKGKLAQYGLQPVLPMAGVSRLAMVAPEKLIRYADGHKYWPQSCTLFKARKTPEIDVNEYKKLFFPGADEEPERFARLTRYMQAEWLRACAQDARENDTVFVAADAAETEFSYASNALIEADGYRRPAYWALHSVWKNVYAFVRGKDSCHPGESVNLSIVVLRENPLGSMKVRCAAYDMQGKAIAACDNGVGEKGEFTLTVPQENGILILRTTVEDANGKIMSRCDRLLCVSDGCPLEPLWNPPRTRLSVRGNTLFNEGESAALAVSTNGYYGALLPGESVASGESFECLNAIL